MDLRDSPDEAAFREGVRAWLADNLPAGDHARVEPQDLRRRLRGPDLARGVRRQGRAVQPPGDRARGVRARRAPQHMGVIGLGMAGPTIMAHGTEEQKQRYLPKILSAEEIWCQGFSEPGAGSDLSAVRTKIDVADDKFVVTGQKVWSSFAHIADHCILVGRSDPALRAPRRPHLPDRRHEGARRRGAPAARRSPARPSSTRSSSPTSRCRARTCSARSAAAGRWR